MVVLKKIGSAARRGNERYGLGLGLVRSTSFGRKRVALSDLSIEFEDSDDDCGPITVLKRQCFQDSFLTPQKSLLEDLPQEVLIRILCGVEHDDLKRLYLVSKTIREATLIAKQSHFAYSTPQKKLMFRDMADFDDYDEIKAPNAPRVSRTRLSAKKLSDISVALFASDNEVAWPRGVDSCTEMGFRKIGVEHQCEYENVNFQEGKEYLLSNIKRRSQIPGRIITRRSRKSKASDQSSMKRDNQEISHATMSKLKSEIGVIKRNHTEMEWEILALETELKCVEKKSKRLIKCLAKACDANGISESMDIENNEDEAKKKTLEMEDTVGFEGNKVVHLFNEDFNNEVDVVRVSRELAFWEKVLEDTNEGDEMEPGIEMDNRQEKIARDLKSLIDKPADKALDK